MRNSYAKTCRALSVLLVLSIGGCGTIMHGKEQVIQVRSDPSGATVHYDGAIYGMTPCNVRVSRRNSKAVLLFQKYGYSDREVVLRNGISMWALLGNLLIGGIPGYIIDSATGSFGAYEQDSCDVVLNAVRQDPSFSDTDKSTISQNIR